MDGCEIDFADSTAGLWDSVVVDSTPDAFLNVKWGSTVKRTGNGSVRFQSFLSSTYIYLSKTISSVTELYMGFGFYWDSAAETLAAHAGNCVPMVVLASSTGAYQITLGIDVTSNVLKVFTGGTSGGTLQGTGSIAVSANTMHYVELHAVIHDSAGVIDVRLNGNSEIAVTGIDTNSAGGDIVTVLLGIVRSAAGGAFGGAGALFYDDIIINDTAGSVSNSWPGGAGIEMLTPNADGNYTAWTSTGGAVDYTEIDDVTTYGNLPDDNTTTILSAVANQRTSVGLAPTTLAGSVEAIMLCTYAKNSASGSDQMAQGVRIGSTDYDSTAFVPATSYGWRNDVLTLNPATAGRWLTSELDTMEQGFLRVT